MFVQGWRFLQSFEVIAHLQLESLDHSDDTGWWLMYLRIFFHPPPSGDDPNPVYDKQCKQYIHNTQLIFLARSLVNFTNSNIFLLRLLSPDRDGLDASREMYVAQITNR